MKIYFLMMFCVSSAVEAAPADFKMAKCKAGDASLCLVLAAEFEKRSDLPLEERVRKSLEFSQYACDGKEKAGCLNAMLIYYYQSDFSSAKTAADKFCALGKESPCFTTTLLEKCEKTDRKSCEALDDILPTFLKNHSPTRTHFLKK